MSLVTLAHDAGSGIATLTLNRPDVLNAIDVPLARALHAAVLSLQDSPGLRCVVLRGAGRAFAAGGDLRAFAADFDAAAGVIDDLLDALEPVVRFLAGHPVPVLASVHGTVAGAGLSLAAACDLVIASDDTRFLLAYDRIGAPPDCGASYFLPRLLGPRRAAGLMYLGETWDAATAERHGLVSQVVPAGEREAAALALAARLAEGPTRAFGQYKRLAGTAAGDDLDRHLAAERAAFREATRSNDFRAGVSAFLARQPARFTGS